MRCCPGTFTSTIETIKSFEKYNEKSQLIYTVINYLENTANLTYEILNKYSQVYKFPTELAVPEYLAKSDMVHWLIYPTELGQKPDEIEYLGKVEKGEEYHIFRYRSRSDNLSDDLKGEWLIGWSSNEGGTFSNFDRYELFEKRTVEKTLKHIRKKLL